MAYEPAINTTVTPAEKTKYWLDKAVEAAGREGVTIVGFIICQGGANPSVEPFSSSAALGAKDFVELMTLLARQMLTEDEPVN